MKSEQREREREREREGGGGKNAKLFGLPPTFTTVLSRGDSRVDSPGNLSPRFNETRPWVDLERSQIFPNCFSQINVRMVERSYNQEATANIVYRTRNKRYALHSVGLHTIHQLHHADEFVGNDSRAWAKREPLFLEKVMITVRITHAFFRRWNIPADNPPEKTNKSTFTFSARTLPLAEGSRNNREQALESCS